MSNVVFLHKKLLYNVWEWEIALKSHPIYNLEQMISAWSARAVARTHIEFERLLHRHSQGLASMKLTSAGDEVFDLTKLRYLSDWLLLSREVIHMNTNLLMNTWIYNMCWSYQVPLYCTVVCAPLFEPERFPFLFWTLGRSLRMLGGPLHNGSIWLRFWCTYLCCVLCSCTSHTSLLFHGIFSLCAHI